MQHYCSLALDVRDLALITILCTNRFIYVIYFIFFKKDNVCLIRPQINLSQLILQNVTSGQRLGIEPVCTRLT